ncbi:TIGR02680 family protein [Nocardia xishanensis]|uniref:TIGR02680 family protein n=1 Tax=Nocardia xishanensis TaxID=238964 RepID=UPI0008344589|nr:TIGR02680 family protein [Nocardia xishanensis]
MTVTTLPNLVPTAEREPRWVPTRAGIVNIWRYYDEILEFHDGRLLLRGPNGSGKSKALELLLPFLFDANLRANRLSTFGTNERTMHWNLMGEGASGATRVGYVWLEFRFPGESGRWFTCGARLQATSRTTTVHADYFTTALRVSDPDAPDSLALTDANRPLTKAALAERLGEQGTVHENATEYRAAVRSTLFPAMGADRYDALITALLQLRTPKLSQRLDPALLSSLLSSALPPLDRDEIADLAEGFERLDAQRERLARLGEEVAATRKLARQQQTYAQRVLRSAAATLSAATTEMDKLADAAKSSAAEYERIAALEMETIERVGNSEADLSIAEGEREGLIKSPAYQKGLELDDRRRETAKARRWADDAEAKSAELLSRAERDGAKHATALQAVDQWERVVATAGIEAGQSGRRAGMTGIHDELAADPGSRQSRTLLSAAVRAKRGQVDDMLKVLTRHDNAVARRTDAETDLDKARAALLAAEHEHAESERAFETELGTLREAVWSWAGSCDALSFDDPDTISDLVEDRPALVEAANRAATLRLQEVTRQETLHQNEIDAVTALRDACADEREQLALEQDIPPEPPRWRTADRAGRAGAPLWRLIDFADGLAPRTAAGVEAALESCGLLDAWVGARGEVAGHDLFADPSAVEPVSGRSLAEVLVPVPGADVAPEQVNRLLSSIAFGERLPGEAVAAVGADGAWRLATATGSWSKDHPAFIGASTRAKAREAHIQRLLAEIASHDRRLDELREQLDHCAAHRALIESERANLPAFTEVDAAEKQLTRTESALSTADAQVRDRAATLTTREVEVRQTQHALAVAAAETGLPTDRLALGLVVEAIENFAGQAGAWLDSHADLRAARGTADTAQALAEQSAADATTYAKTAAAAEDEYRRAAAELAAIEESARQDYQETLTRINQVRARVRALNDSIKTDRATLTDLAHRLGKLDSQRATDLAARDTAIASRDEVALRFRHLAGGTFPEDGRFPDLPKFRATLTASEGVRAALDAARMISAAWPTIPHSPTNISEAMRRLADSVHECRTALSTRADLDLESDGEVQVFAAVIDGVRVGCAELLRIIEDEAKQAENEITEHERRLFDHTLTGDTRRHLAARIRQANELVDGMNTRLKMVRTASNVAVELVWQVGKDLPPGTKAARELLLKDPARLTETDRESLHRFLRERIEAAKAADTATSWEQQLTQVFDYTKWHQFIVKVDRGSGDGFQELTKKLHGALSGGEKAIALHLPLFAAVAAHYQSTPSAPRVIMLDEVFVGVDTANRGQIFALLSALDLDLVLTSDHEWCTYAELSGIGIHQIISGDGQDAVTTARFTWDGEELLPV